MDTSKLKNFLLRSVSALILLPLFLFIVKYNKWTYFFLFSIINVLALSEYCSMFKFEKTNKYFTFLLSFSIFSSFFLYRIGFYSTKIFILPYFILLLLIYRVLLTGKININYIKQAGLSIFGLAYITLPMSLMHSIVIKNSDYNYKILLGIFLCIWATDTGAYIAGNLIGKTKCFKNISPSKTLEGVIGGLLLSTIVSFLVRNNLFFENFSVHWYVLGIVIGIGSVLGDLLESYLKRCVDVKNSGELIPGHGGMLDRFDSFLLVIGLIWVLEGVLF